MSIYLKEDEQAIAMRKLLPVIKESIEERGGKVIGSGFGVVFPRPRKSRPYRDRDGKVKRTSGFDGRLTEAFLDSCFPRPF